MPSPRRWLLTAAALLCGLPAWSLLAQAPAPYAQRVDVPALTALGRAMFFDANLSASGRVSCASCHDPAHAYGPPNALAVQPGGSVPADRSGFRAAPSLRYGQSVPPFSEHFFDNEGDDSVDMGPTGGRTWDGRVSSAHEQARIPLLAKAEMGNASAAAVVAKLKRAPYAEQLRDAFGADLFERGDTAVFDAALMALEVFQQSPAEFYPYSSRYDAVLRGQATLNAQQARGLALFNAADKGNCASCHLSEPTPDGAFPLFTDFGHIAIGVPRNRSIPANADPRFFDLGLCGPVRTDLSTHAEYCGLFRTPTLRNIAVKQRFFHNGVIDSLDDAVRFYVQRDTDPARWYGRGLRFDDLPTRYHANVNVEPPFGGLPGDKPALDDTEIADIVAFLKTLTDADLLRLP
ncbi:MAG: cytochrome c peroxidase [Burkholderiales bacterium]